MAAVCWQLSPVQANDFAAELVERLAPLAYWRFDGDNEHVLLDATERYVGLSQGGVTITRRGAMQVENDGSLSFDGQRDCVVVRHHDDFLIDQGTVTCWLRADDVDRPQGVLSKDANGFGDGGHLTISLDKGKIVVRLQSTTESHEVRANVGKERWTHVAFTFGSDGMLLFVDGKLVDSHAYAGGLGGSSGGKGNHEPLVFGASTMISQAASESPLENFYKGNLDEVAVFARQLAPGEITELANAAKPQYTSLAGAYIANHPTAWWRLNEPAGSTVALDQVGRQHGNYNVVGSSYFDGDDFVDVGTLDLDDASFTILAHIQPTSLTGSGARIIAKENGSKDEDQFWSLSTTIRDDKARLRFRLRTKDGTKEAVSNEGNLTVNEPVFVAAVYNGHTMRLYQDGELVGKVEHHGLPMTNAHCHVWIGDSPSGAGKRPFAGEIKDVAILRDAISADHIRAIYHASRRPVGPTPAANSPDLAASANPAESLPSPADNGANPIQTPPPQAPQVAVPFVHRCPLCDVHYQEVPIYRVSLPGMIPLPACEVPYYHVVQP